MDKNCKNCTFRERSYGEYPCDKCRSGSNWTPSGNLIDFAIEELEKIKSKLNCKYLNNYKYSAVTVACILNDLDNRIKELKGEQK